MERDSVEVCPHTHTPAASASRHLRPCDSTRTHPLRHAAPPHAAQAFTSHTNTPQANQRPKKPEEKRRKTAQANPFDGSVQGGSSGEGGKVQNASHRKGFPWSPTLKAGGQHKDIPWNIHTKYHPKRHPASDPQARGVCDVLTSAPRPRAHTRVQAANRSENTSKRATTWHSVR